MLKNLILLCGLYPLTLQPQINHATNSGLTFGSTSCVLTTATTMTIGACVLKLPNPAAQLNNTSSSATFGPVSSTAITFGLNNTVELLKDCTIGSSDQAWIFAQNATIEGKGHVLTLGQAQAIQVSGSATLTIKGANIVIAARDALTCTSTTATVVLQDCNLILGYEGLAWPSGNLTVSGNTAVAGYQKVAWPDPSGAELLLRAQNVGFGAIGGAYAGSTLYALDFCGPTEERAGITMARVDKTGAAYFSDSFQPDAFTWTAIPGGAVYKHISVGTDGTIWVVNTSNQVIRYRMHKDGWGATPTNTTASNITAMQVACGDRFNLYALNTSTGLISKCNDPDRGGSGNPLTGAPQTWTSYPDINAISIAAGTDGTFWYIRNDGKAFMNYNGVDTLIHNGEDMTFVKISAKGTKDRNTVILTDSANNRAIICHDNTNWKDLGLSNIVEAATDVDGNVLCIFQNAKIAEDGTLGAPLYYRHSFNERPVLATDRTLTFSANSSANLTIASGSTLTMTQGTTLRMNADCDFADTGYNARRHLVFSDSGSTLFFDRANLEAVCAGLTLTSGNILINGLCRFKASTWLNSHIEISSKVKIKILAGSELQEIGRVVYCKPSRLLTETNNENPNGGLPGLFFGNGQPIPLYSYEPIPTLPSRYCSFVPSFILESAKIRGGTVLSGPGIGATQYLLPGFADRPTNGANNVSDNPILPYLDAGGSGITYYYNPSDINQSSNGSVYVTSTTDLTYVSSSIARAASGGAHDIDENGNIITHAGTGGSRQLLYNTSGTGSTVLLGTPSWAPRRSYRVANNLTYWMGYDPTQNSYRSSANLSTIASTLLSTYSTNLKAFSIMNDGTVWFIDGNGNIKYIPIGGSIKNYRGPRGLGLQRIQVIGTMSNYKILMSYLYTGYNYAPLIYSADSSRVATIERASGGYPGDFRAGPGLARNGIFTAPDAISAGGACNFSLINYMYGHQPSTWPYPRGKHQRVNFCDYAHPTQLATPWAQAEGMGYGLLGKNPRAGTQTGIWSDRDAYTGTRIAFVTGLTSGTANRIYIVKQPLSVGMSDLMTGAVAELLLTTTNLSLYTTSSNLGGVSNLPNRSIAAGIDGTVLTSGNTISLWNGTTWTVIDTDITGQAYYKDVACANASQIFKINPDGTVWKWASGTTWNTVSIYPSKFARAIAAGTDGALWFIDEKGILKFRSTTGTITTLVNGTGQDFCRLSVAGSSTSYKLIAVDRRGNLWSADSTRTLEFEGIGLIDEACVSVNGSVAIAFKSDYATTDLALGRIYIGWIKGSNIPSTWPYKRTV